MIKLELTGAEVEIILFLIRDWPASHDSDYLDVLHNTIVTQLAGQEG